MAPPPRLTLSEWADAKRRLGSKTSAEPGAWRTARAPYLREPMDCCTDPLVSEVSCVFPAQVGKTEGMINNTIGYYMDQDPSPILAVFESEEKSEAWSRERLVPMLMDTPCLTDKVQFGKGPDSSNTKVFKDFPGGYLAIVGAGSEADLSSRPIRILLKDELDKWKMLKAGDPDSLADKRTSTFFNRKIINVSTPREAETSRIMRKYRESDQRQYYVPCPFCGHMQILREAQIKFTRPGNTGDVTDDVKYACEKCDLRISHMHKRAMLTGGRWIADKPFNGHAGFHLSALYSPWITWKEYIEAFLRMKRQSDTYKSFVNEWRAEAWDPQMGSAREVSPYLQRRGDYNTVPAAAVLLTAAVDIQKDRIEVEVKAWGEGRQSFGVDFKVFYGTPHLLTDTRQLPDVWKMLDSYLAQTWVHEYGAVMKIDYALIDQGYLLDEVQKFCKPRRGRNIRPCRGSSTVAHELVGRAKKNNRMKVSYFPIGGNAAKGIIFSNLEIEEPGPGFMSWNKAFDEEYFKQLLTSERPKKDKNGVVCYEKISPAARNEALDLNVYNLAAYELAKPLMAYRTAEIAQARAAWEAEASSESGVRSSEEKTGARTLATAAPKRRTLSRGIE